MIAPDVRMTWLDPEGFAWLNRVVRRRRDEDVLLSVLHEGDRVLQVVHARDGVVSGVLERVGPDRAATAEALRAQTGVDRVLLIDRARIGEVAADVVDLAASTRVQGQLLLGAQERFWSSSAVATSPEPPISPWPPVVAALRAIGDGVVLLGAWRGEVCLLTLRCVVEAGLVVDVTSLADPPPRARCEEAVRQAGADAALLLDAAVAERILLAPSPLVELGAARAAGEVLACIGLDGDRWPARR